MAKSHFICFSGGYESKDGVVACTTRRQSESSRYSEYGTTPDGVRCCRNRCSYGKKFLAEEESGGAFSIE